MKLNASILTGELPVDSRFGFISPILVSFDLSPQSLFIRDSSIQTLPHQHAQLDLRHTQPTGVLRRVMKLKLAKYSPCFPWLKGFIQRRPLMGVEIVHHYSDHLSLRVSLVNKPFHLMGKVALRPSRSHINMSPSSLWLAKHKQVACAVALILIIK